MKQKISVNYTKHKFVPNKVFEEIKSCYHPLNKEYEIQVILYPKGLREVYTNSAKRSLFFYTSDKQEYERTLTVLKRQYYGKENGS